METRLGRQSQDELIAVNGASLAAVTRDIKLENGEMMDNKLTSADSKSFTAYPPQLSSASYGDDWSLFASYTASSCDNSLGEQPASMQVQIPLLESCRETPPALLLSSLQQLPSVPYASSQVPLTSSQTLAPCASFQTSVTYTSSQGSVPFTNKTSTLFTSSKPSVPVTVCQSSVPFSGSHTSVSMMSSQLSVPVTSSQPSVPLTSPQPSVPVITTSQPSSSTPTWYRQPSSVSSLHPHPVSSALSPVSTRREQSSSTTASVPAVEEETGSAAATSTHQAGVPTQRTSSTDHVLVGVGGKKDRMLARGGGRRAEQQGDIEGWGGAVTCQEVLEKEEEKSAVMMKQAAVEQSGRWTRKAARACAERVERTTRRLRARQQNCKTPPEVEKETTASPGLERPVFTSDPSPAPHAQELEMVPPAAQVLKPRRITRKPRHTQRVWRPDIQGDPFDRWCFIGQTQGLTSDTEIAVFLMQHYENAASGRPSRICMTCHAVLTLTCAVCQGQAAEMGSPALHIPGMTANSMEIQAKTEPVDPSPQPGVEMRPDLEPEFDDAEPEGFLEAGDETDKEEEEKPQTKRRKRGRPAGSGKKSPEKTGGPKIKLKTLRKYKCTYEGCSAAFAKSSRLKIHSRIHTGEKPYACKDCGKAFTQKSGLTVHSQKHTGLRPFACQECGSCFPSSSTLKQHMRRHTGEKPFACNKCGKTFRWSGHLTQHLRMHDGIKPFLCPDCGKSFSASSDLVKHRVTHTKSRPYKCDLCDKAYAFQHRLTAHQRSHTGDRPFLCSECGAAFSRAHNLTVHMRTHTGDKPYWCKDCGAKFSDSGNFCKHKKTKHGENAKTAHHHAPKTKGVPANSAKAADDSAAAAPISDLTATLDESKLFDYELLVMMGKDKEADEEDAAGTLPSIAEAVSKAVVVEPSAADSTVRLPSMAKMASQAKRKRDREGGNLALTSVSSSTPSPTSLACDLPADLKSMVPALGAGLSIGLPTRFSSVGSPPALLIHSRLSVSPTLSPAASLPAQGSPGPAASGDSGLSALSASQPSLTEYQVPRHDGVVFPPQYYTSYPNYCQQQQ